MQTNTLFSKITSLAVCFGVLLSGPVMAGDGVIRDVELSKDGVLYGQIYNSHGKAVPNAVVQLRYRGTAVAAAKSDDKGLFAISGVRGGAHEVVVGPLRSPVRLWANGAAPKNATRGIAVAVNETIVRGQDVYCEDACDAPTTGFGLLDVITLATVGSAVGALVVAIDNNDEIKKIQAQLPPASP